jgi:hypothetical protein
MVDAGRVHIPLSIRSIKTGARVIQARVTLLLQSIGPSLVPVDFIVDPGCGITSMPRLVAEEHGIPIPARTTITKISVRSSTGSNVQRVRLGKIGVRVPGLSGRIFHWNGHFVEPPHAPHMSLLGLDGVLDDLRLIFDGSYSIEHPYGQLILELSRTPGGRAQGRG